MKKLILYLNRTKLISKIGIFVIVLSMLSTTGCQFIVSKFKSNESNGLEYGYTMPNRGEGTIVDCAYKSDKKEFDINDVTLIFSYGTNYSPEIDITLKDYFSFPTFELWFCNEDNDTVLIKKVEENLISEKYRCYYTYTTEYEYVHREFNHSENITIPYNLFTNEKGYVIFGVCAANIIEKNPEVETLGLCVIYYKKSGDTVTLSTTEF